MDELEVSSLWQRPDEPTALIRGTLSCTSRGIVLASDRPMVSPRRQAGVEEFNLGTVYWPIVHGRGDDGRAITLLEAEGRVNPVGDHSTRAQAALIGDQPVSANAFAQVRMSFDWLTAWLEPGVLYDRGAKDDDQTMKVDLAEKPLCSAELDFGALTFLAGAKWQLARNSVSATRWTCIDIKLNDPLPWRELLDQHVRPLQDFLIVALGRSVGLTSLIVRAEDESVEVSNDGLKGPWWFDVKVPLIQRDAVTVADRGALNAYPSSVLLGGQDLIANAEEILRGWYEVNARNRTAIMRLNAQAYAPFNYLSNQSAGVAQAFESLFLGECEAKQKSKTEHAERVAMVHSVLEASSLDSETVAWATGVVQSRNDKSFPERFADVLTLSGELGRYLADSVPDLDRQLAGLRHAVSHGSSNSKRPSRKDPEITRMFCLKELGTWAMRTALLELAGARVAPGATKNPQVAHAVAQLTAEM